MNVFDRLPDVIEQVRRKLKTNLFSSLLYKTGIRVHLAERKAYVDQRSYNESWTNEE